ncbi:hypothetical protein GGR90_003860 [Sphingopyxis italica]|uniref:LVIVD repeat-containing protein n=2 Tax=Sphingopyxis italica TaxID=1129133 RepID=A0A7X6BA96_9SPHN|nr:hypothetical protein [Sphingopyxis italica]NJB91640.1 hypothetical protein [Sphingopyxis italica]
MLMRKLFALIAFVTLCAAFGASAGRAAEEEKPLKIEYRFTPPAPREQGDAAVAAKSNGCYSCHTRTDQPSMHATPAVKLGCTDCHGGDSTSPAAFGKPELGYKNPYNIAAMKVAHPQPTLPGAWHDSSANPERSYTLLNKEAPEFIRFVNPSDYRVAREACGACHLEIIEATERSQMSTAAMFWAGAAYNNGIVPFKQSIFGEAYTRDGDPACVLSPSSLLTAEQYKEACKPSFGFDKIVTDAEAKRGALAKIYPLPRWNVMPPSDVFRVFERGGRNINTQFPEIGLPNPTGSIQRLEEPGRPDLKQSNRGPGTGLRIAIAVLNLHKTRLNDPYMWFMGTNDQPGDYRHSGCSGCHVIYANDREPRHSLTYAKFGRDGETATVDPTIAGKLAASGGEAHGGDEHGGGGHGALVDPTRSHAPDNPRRKEAGHPISHAFTRAIPTSQCMTCHMHQPNIFLNSYLGYTMWDYESDAPQMWPGPENSAPRPPGMSDEDYQRKYKQQRYPTAAEVHQVLERNPEGAAPRGLWSDVEFLRDVYDVNDTNKDTQFADYHGHGWNFRGVFKRDRSGNLLTADGNMATYGTDTANIVDPNDPEKWRKSCASYSDPKERELCLSSADPERPGVEGKFVPPGLNPGKTVHMMDIHAEKGMQCADCHFAQDSHGNGYIQGEVANAIEISCKDCHGTADAFPNLLTSNVAARPQGNNLALLRNPDGRRRFEFQYDDDAEVVGLIQRSIVDPKLEWRVSLVKQAVTPGPHFNAKAARAKLMARSGSEDGKYEWGPGVAKEDRAHGDDKMTCFTCHLSWTTSCGGCHLPIEANWKTKSHHFEGEETRNFATYNPQVARDEMFQLGRHQLTKPGEPGPNGEVRGIITPVRSTSALVLSSTNINRERIYVQQPPISAAGYSSQAFAPHFPHTVRRSETKQCSDCHLSAADDNNAIMSQLLLLGTNFVNFVGLNVWSGMEDGFQATRVTEWDEPQAVIGSYLHRYSYPDYWKLHVDQNGRELKNWVRGKIFDKKGSGETHALEEFANIVQDTSGRVNCLQQRGEYMFVAEGKGGFRVYDVASIGNKGFSERIVRAPFSPLGHDTHVKTKNATCMAIATTQPISVARNENIVKKFPENHEQVMHDIYRYAVITDSVEGLVLVDIDTLADGEFRNNRLKRALTWNEGNVLAGARHVTLAGSIAYVTTDAGLVVLDLTVPLQPKVTAQLPLTDARASAIQFRYLWVTDAEGVKLFDVTKLTQPVAVPSGTVRLADARKIYLARTYMYVAAKADGLVIVDVTRPAAPIVWPGLTFGGALIDAEDVIVASTNASLFGYVADGRNGIKVLQLTSPDDPGLYGFSPKPTPELIAWAKTPSPALALSKGLDRDRAVDETGGQMAVFGRIGSRPFTRGEMEKLFLNSKGMVYKVRDEVDESAWRPPLLYAN